MLRRPEFSGRRRQGYVPSGSSLLLEHYALAGAPRDGPVWQNQDRRHSLRELAFFLKETV